MKFFLVPQPDGEPFELTRAVTLVGRQRDCDMPVVDSDRISRRHCCVVQVDEEYHVRDLGSTNGIRVNRKRVDRVAKLRSGDILTVGDKNFLFVKGEVVSRARDFAQTEQIPVVKDRD